MYPVLGACPVCNDSLLVTRLTCPACHTAIEGQFQLNRFQRLNAEQLAFLETFIRLEGKVTWVAEELGLSYPTARNRLVDVIRALGYEPREEVPAEQRQRAASQRQAVLDDLAAGKITPEEAIQVLRTR